MVLGNKERLLTTSTAAGPAFEGGNIICGVASIPGSISAVKIHNQRAIVKTIQDIFPPIGICGTGVVSGVAELIRNRLIDNQGNLSAPYHLQGYPLWVYQNGERIALHQKDIREFQMAKAAIGVGIDILIKEYGCQLEDVKSIYIAGGFGTYLTKEDALTTGLLPKGFCGEIQYIGNGALRGTIAVGMECDAMELGCQRNYWEEIIEKTEYIHLSENVHFQELYMKQLSFETIA